MPSIPKRQPSIGELHDLERKAAQEQLRQSKVKQSAHHSPAKTFNQYQVLPRGSSAMDDGRYISQALKEDYQGYKVQ